MSRKALSVLCASRAQTVANLAYDDLKPEFDLIHFTLATAIKEELPFLLTNQILANLSSQAGSHGSSVPLVPIIS